MFILWVRYWLIYAMQSVCLPGQVDICVCLFNQKWLGPPALTFLMFSQKVNTLEFLLSVDFAVNKIYYFNLKQYEQYQSQ